jgi:hypothetical protein
MTTHYPILFGFRDLVVGAGFVADISTQGRALLVDEGEEGFWMYGVNPGGIAGSGETTAEAQADFRQRYKSVLFDFASVSQGFEDFEKSVQKFFAEVNEPTEEEWNAAVQDVRAGKVEADWLAKGRAESKRQVKVRLIDQPQASVNALDEPPKLAVTDKDKEAA